MITRLCYAFLPFAIGAAIAVIARPVYAVPNPRLLVDHGRSDYHIVVSPDASPAVYGAAVELATDIDLATGVRLPVGVAKTTRHAIYLSVSSRAGRGASLPDEGYSVRTDGGDVYLTGGGDRGVVYAVDRLLEDQVGVRWYAPDCVVIPRRDVIALPGGVRDEPAFAYRDTDMFEVRADAAFDAHARLNGISLPGMTLYGGINQGFNGAENFYGLVPPDKYFATHPEYYSLIDGKRTADSKSQLCLTNPDVFKLVVDGLVAWAKQDTSLTVLGLSPNDARGGWCTCDACKAADAKLGGPGGTVLDFVNRVAAAVNEQLPDRHLKVETLAYLYTAAPPSGVKPASNVIVCYAPLLADVGHGLDSPSNASFRRELGGWAAIAPPGSLHVWHYAANFTSFLQPLPDWDEIGADLQLYRKMGVAGVFIEGDYASPGEMMALRTWLIGRLLWNPDQPVWPLISEFCDAYYGKAGPHIVAYLRAMSAPLARPGTRAGIYDTAVMAPFLTPSSLAAARAAFERAAMDADDDTSRRRVAEAAFGVRAVDVELGAPSKTAAGAERGRYRASVDRLYADLKAAGVAYYGEGYALDAWHSDALAAAGG